MKLENEALQELYETIINGTFVLSMYAASPIDKAFRECDEKLSESVTFEHIKNLQSDNDILKRSNEVLLSANMDLCTEKGYLKNRISKLEKDLDDAVKENEKLRREVSTKDKRNNKLQKQLLNVIPDHTDESAKKEIDFLRISKLEWAKRAVDRRKERDDAREECERLNADNNKLSQQRDYYKSISDDLQRRVHHAEDEVEKLKEHALEDQKIIANINSERNDLIKDLDDAKKQLKYFTQSRDDWRSRAKHAEKEVEDLKLKKDHDNAAIHELIDIKNEALSANKKLETECETLKVEITGLKERVEYLKKENKWLRAACITWAKRACERGKQISELKATLEKTNADRTELQNDRDSYHDLYTELRKDYDKLLEEKRKSNARTDCLRTEVNWYRKHYKEKSDKIGELKKQLGELTSQYQKLTIENKRLRDDGMYQDGQTDLWDMLQNVNDSQPNEFDVECEGMEDVISMDLEDFLDAYKKWYEEKEKERLDHMRDYLGKFCRGRLCSECPLGSDEYKCGHGYSFRKFANDDYKIISDEELERYYEKVKTDDPCSGVREKTKEACDAFYDGFKAGLASEVKEVPVSCDIPIKDLASWECTIEATVEVNKDLLEKVCGVKPEEEEHKLEYGDAVRLPWRDYDYMYIGPEGKHICLFDPKSHDVVVVSVTENMTYQGCKIVICDEDDLRKIWNHKK